MLLPSLMSTYDVIIFIVNKMVTQWKLPGTIPNGYLVRSYKILTESYKRMHRLTRFSDRILQDKHSSYKNLTR